MERHKNFSWMEEQAATINLQVYYISHTIF